MVETAINSVMKLREFAKRRHLRVRPCELFDANVGERVLAATRLEHEGIRMEVGAAPSLFSVEARCETELVFSVNAANRVVSGVDVPATFGHSLDSSIYIHRDWDNRAVKRWVENLGHQRLVAQLGLDTAEAMHVFRNGVICVLRASRSLDDVLLSRVAAVTRAIASKGTEANRSVDLSPLPAGLAELLQDFVRLAESDDSLRAELVDNLSHAERVAILHQVVPRLPEVNRYLDSLVEPWSDAALKLADLAQLASEVAVSRPAVP